MAAGRSLFVVRPVRAGSAKRMGKGTASQAAEKCISGTRFAIGSFSEAALAAGFPPLTNAILLPNLVFFRSLFSRADLARISSRLY